MGEYFTCKICGMNRVDVDGYTCGSCTIALLRSQLAAAEARLERIKEAAGEVVRLAAAVVDMYNEDWFAGEVGGLEPIDDLEDGVKAYHQALEEVE